MARRLRISILYNEPTTGTIGDRQFITQNGRLQSSVAAIRGHEKPDKHAPFPAVDLSEIGVMEEMEDIKRALTSLGYRVSVMNVDSDVFRLIEHLREEGPDLIFNLVECIENESAQEMNVAGLYDLLKIPYTGAGAFALGLALNKPRVKELLTYHGIKTPPFHVFEAPAKIGLPPHLEFPLIVKPSKEDASVGISDASIVTTEPELRRRVRFVLEEFQQPALVESYIDGRELNVAVIGYRKPVVLPISEIDFSGLHDGMARIVSYDAKWMTGTVAYEGTKGICPARLPSHTEAKLREIALRAFRIVGCRDYARVDFRLAANGELFLLEVNPNPDISDDAGFARSARAHGLTFPQIVGKIVESALDRHGIPRA
jgi:D-alanine-D-alanine ligase